MMKHFNRLACATAFLTLAQFSFAHAGTPLIVEMDQSQPMLLTGDVGSIIVGNPSIADVSLNGRQIILHGHSFGETNLVIFDTNGHKLVDFDVTVSHNTSNQLSLFVGSSASPAQRYSYSCAPSCEVNMMVGDNADWMGKVVGSNRQKNDYKTGVKTSDLTQKSAANAVPPQ